MSAARSFSSCEFMIPCVFWKLPWNMYFAMRAPALCCLFKNEKIAAKVFLVSCVMDLVIQRPALRSKQHPRFPTIL